MAGLTIDPTVDTYINDVNYATGLNVDTVASHWIAEEGPRVVESSDWSAFYNNPAGMTHGTPAVDKLSNGTVFNGYGSDGTPIYLDTFPTSKAGMEAYINDIETDSNFAGIRKSAVNSNVGQQLEAIANSPWGTPASGLLGAYNTLAGTHYANLAQLTGKQGTAPNPAGLVQVGTTDGVGGVISAVSGSNSGNFLGTLMSGKGLVIVIGVVLIILFGYKTFAG